MPCVVGGFMQSGRASEANQENNEDTEKQRCHSTGYLAPHTLSRISGRNCPSVHHRSSGSFTDGMMSDDRIRRNRDGSIQASGIIQ